MGSKSQTSTTRNLYDSIVSDVDVASAVSPNSTAAVVDGTPSSMSSNVVVVAVVVVVGAIVGIVDNNDVDGEPRRGLSLSHCPL